MIKKNEKYWKVSVWIKVVIGKCQNEELKGTNVFMVRKYHIEVQHQCQRNYDLNHVDSKFVAEEFVQMFIDNPRMN